MISKQVLFVIGIFAAFMSGAFISSPELRTWAAATIGSAEIIDNSITGTDIQSDVSLSGNVKIDDPTLYIDSKNNRVGIKGRGPADTLQVNLGRSPPIDAGISLYGSSATGGVRTLASK